MEKVKNILAIVIKVLILIGAITLLVFYLVVPNETKAFISNIFEWLSTPVGITGISILSLGYILYKIIPLLPFSKTAKNKLQEEYNKEKSELKAYKEEIANKVNELNNTKNECIAILGGYKDNIDNLTDIILKMCETSPNAKIKAIGEDYKTNKDKIEKDISEKYNLLNNKVNNKVNEINSAYNSILKDIEELKESVYGKTEETTNI